MRPGWKWVAAMAVLVLGIVVSVSGAATSGSTSDGGGTGSDRERGLQLRADGPGPPGPPGRHLETLADELGVSEEKLRDALEAVREDLRPPQRPERLRPPSRAEMEERCNEFTDALGKELGKSGDEVRDAMKSAAKKEIEEAVDDGHLTRRQADRILSRIDDAACGPVFAFKAGGPGCGLDGPGGRHGRFERRLPPRGDSGSEGSSVVIPAPMGAPA
jgi:hypothetical protein